MHAAWVGMSSRTAMHHGIACAACSGLAHAPLALGRAGLVCDACRAMLGLRCPAPQVQLEALHASFTAAMHSSSASTQRWGTGSGRVTTSQPMSMSQATGSSTRRVSVGTLLANANATAKGAPRPASSPLTAVRGAPACSLLLHEVIGQGSCGMVLRATQWGLERAVKVRLHACMHGAARMVARSAILRFGGCYLSVCLFGGRQDGREGRIGRRPLSSTHMFRCCPGCLALNPGAVTHACMRACARPYAGHTSAAACMAVL